MENAMEKFNESTISRFLKSEISFYLTVLTALAAFVGLYYGLSNRIDLLSQEVRFHTGQSGTAEQQVKDLQARVTEIEKQIIILKR